MRPRPSGRIQGDCEPNETFDQAQAAPLDPALLSVSGEITGPSDPRTRLRLSFDAQSAVFLPGETVLLEPYEEGFRVQASGQNDLDFDGGPDQTESGPYQVRFSYFDADEALLDFEQTPVQQRVPSQAGVDLPIQPPPAIEADTASVEVRAVPPPDYDRVDVYAFQLLAYQPFSATLTAPFAGGLDRGRCDRRLGRRLGRFRPLDLTPMCSVLLGEEWTAEGRLLEVTHPTLGASFQLAAGSRRVAQA